jgi:WD40 repeat protein
MADAVRDGDVRPADPEDTIDAADPTAEQVPVRVRPPIEVIAATRDYPQLSTVDRQHYVIAGEIAKGGMGRVLEARDLRLGRAVAIKELLPKNRDAARRFEREARITARLQHPAIIHVYEAGVWPGGEPFYAMPKVAGRSLDKVVAERTTLAERLSLLPNVIAVADALAYAHNENVIHRDLKPANVLVGEFGETVVIDWGLAKDLGAPSDPKESLQLRLRATAEETVSGSVVGTPAYMPPEQARGDAVDQRADVYALGALLYKVLAGDPPYKGDTSKEVLELVKTRPPTPIQELVPDAPPDLIAIVGKAMARDPDDRYITASALAQDLKRFETGQLVGAHHYTVGQLARRWLRRHRVAVGVASAALVAMVILGVISVRQIVEQRRIAEIQRAKAQQGRTQLLEEHGRAELLASHWGSALAYFAGALEDGKTGGARGYMIADARRPFEAEDAHLDIGKGNVNVAVSSDGSHVLTGGNGDIAMWSPKLARLHSFGAHGTTRIVAYDPSGQRVVAAGDDGIARVWNIDGTLVAELHAGGPINAAAFTRDGATLITAGEDAAVWSWDLRSPGTGKSMECHSGPVVSVEVSPDDTMAVTASADQTACIFDLRNGLLERQLHGHRARINAATWSRDGAYVITASDDGTARVWSRTTGKLVVAPLVHAAAAPVEVVLATANHRLITAGADRNVYIWALPATEPIDVTPPPARLIKGPLGGHSGTIITGALSDDEQMLVTGGFDGLAKVWDLQTGGIIQTFEHADVVTATHFISNQLLVTGSRDGTVRVWKVGGAKDRYPLESEIHAVAVASDHSVATGTDDSRVTLLRGNERTVLDGHLGRVYAVAFTADARRLVSGGDDATIVWDVHEGARPSKLASLAIPPPTRGLAIDGDDLVVLTGDTVEVWSLAHKTRTRVLEPNAKDLEAIAVSPRDHRIAAVGRHGQLMLWDASGARVMEDHGGTPYRTVAFSPDGESLVAAGPEAAHVWRLAHGTLGLRFPLTDPTGFVRTAVFSDDGSRVITAGDDGRAHIWDADKGKPLASRDHREKPINAIAVDHDTLWIAGQDGTLGGWDIGVDTSSASQLLDFMREKHILEHLDEDDVVRRGGAMR